MKIIDSELAPKNEISPLITSLSSYREHLVTVSNDKTYAHLESSLTLPFDENILAKVQAMKEKKITKNLKYILIIGIGGSNLGTKALYDAFFGFYDLVEPTRFPKMIFLDTQDETVLAKTSALIQSLSSKEEILVNALSKSGSTTETMSNLEVIIKILKDKFGEVQDRFVFTTDDGSKMHQIANTKGIDVLTLPKTVGGRFSVFSAVGLFPLAMAGFELQAILSGAQEMRDRCLSDDQANPAMTSAAQLYYYSTRGKTIHDLFIFLPQLESLGKWYRQLMGESIGKNGKGITPTVSIGSTDLHSVGQLYLGGPKDKITTFLYGTATKSTLTVPTEMEFHLVEGIQGKKISVIMNAIVSGTKIAYKNQDLPFMEICFDELSAKEISAFMQFKMMEMMYLGQLMKINAFDQPHVELYKTETKRILQEE